MKLSLQQADQDKWVDAGNLTIKDILQNFQGGLTRIISTKESSELATVYNLTVANDHTYYVGHSEVLVHNIGGCLNREWDWEHVLNGSRKTGFHHAPGNILPSGRYTRNRVDGPDEFYTALVGFRTHDGNGPIRLKKTPTHLSTFFPNS